MLLSSFHRWGKKARLKAWESGNSRGKCTAIALLFKDVASVQLLLYYSCSFRWRWADWACWDPAYPSTCCTTVSPASQWQTRRGSRDLRQDQPRRADKETSRQPAASECHPCGEAFQTFAQLAVTHRGTSKDGHDPRSASGLHRWCKERIQEAFGSSSLSFIFHFHPLMGLLMTGAERQVSAALCCSWN